MTEIHKSPNDRREYRALNLHNGLKVLLISDLNTHHQGQVCCSSKTTEIHKTKQVDHEAFRKAQHSAVGIHAGPKCNRSSSSEKYQDSSLQQPNSHWKNKDITDPSSLSNCESIQDIEHPREDFVGAADGSCLSSEERITENANEYNIENNYSWSHVTCNGIDEISERLNTNKLSQSDTAQTSINNIEQSENNETKMAAAALCVNVGSFSDPEDVPGLAHFLEHMLFMGNEKYPDENDFDAFVKRNGGYDNASTDTEMTLFQFEVHPNGLKESLERFSQFFISPLLREDSIDREIQAVDSEFKLNLQKDSARRLQLLAHFARDGHPFRKFLWGNAETLLDLPKEKGINLQESVRNFWQFHYKANLMTLAVCSTASLDTLQELVTQSFSDIPTGDKTAATFSGFPAPFDMEVFHKIYYAIPVKDVHHLEITWVLPPMLEHYRVKPIQYVSWLLGHECKGSVQSLLIRRGLALDVLAGNSESGIEYNTNFSFFTCTINLTDEGIKHLFEVITIVFQYLEMLRKVGPLKEIYDEIKKIEDMNFRFMEQDDPIDLVEDLAENMQLYPTEECITGPLLMFQFDKEVIDAVQNALLPETVNIIVMSKKFAEVCIEKEKWFKTKYCVTEIPNEWTLAWNDLKTNPDLQLPTKNRFIAENFSLVEPDALDTDVPVVIQEKENGILWYKRDRKFKLPKALLYFRLILPLMNSSPQSLTCADIFLNILIHNLKEVAYEASVAQLSYQISLNETGLVMQLEGFNERLRLFFNAIVDEMANFDFSPRTFKIIKRKTLRGYKNYLLKPAKVARSLRLLALQKVRWTIIDKRKAILNLGPNDIKDFAKNLKSKLFIESLIQGNITVTEAAGFQDYLFSKLKCESLLKDEIPQVRVVKLPVGSTVVRHLGFNKTDVNSVITNYYQIGPGNIREFALTELLLYMMEEPCFDILRTQEQLGYSVSCSCRNTFGIIGLSVTVQSEENKFSADFVDNRIEMFLEKFRYKLMEMTDEEFSQQVDSLCGLKRQEDLTLSDEAGRNWAEIYDQTLIFDRLQQEIGELRKLEKGVVLDWLVQSTSPNTSSTTEFRKLSTQIIGSNCENINTERRESQSEEDDISEDESSCDSDSDNGSSGESDCESIDEDMALAPIDLHHLDTYENCITDFTEFKKKLHVYPVSKIR